MLHHVHIAPSTVFPPPFYRPLPLSTSPHALALWLSPHSVVCVLRMYVFCLVTLIESLRELPWKMRYKTGQPSPSLAVQEEEFII